MSIYVQVKMFARSGDPADDVVNSFAWTGGVADGGNAMAIAAALTQFYSDYDEDTMTYPIAKVISGTITRQPALIKMWTITSGDLGEPDQQAEVDIFQGVVAEDVSYPLEVAACLSFGSGPSSGVAPGRRRGRVYLGPLTQEVSSTIDVEAVPHLDLDFRTNCTQAALRSLFAVEGNDGLTHAVWSRAGNVVTAVDRYWMDNEFDIQRRRGHAPTARTMVPA